MTTPPRVWSWEELQLETAAYEQRWWRQDARARQAVAERPGLAEALARRALVRTVDVFRDGQGSWLSWRSELHTRLAAGMCGQTRADPIAFFTIGCMGAGKTRVLRPLVEGARSVRGRAGSTGRVAADEVRAALPEYAGGLGSVVVEPEVYEVTYDLVFPALLESRCDVVYDTIGLLGADGTVSFESQLHQLRDAGYRVEVLLAEAPVALCVERARQRALVEGRMVKAAVQERQAGQPMRALATLRDRGLVDDWVIVDSSGSADEPSMIDGSDAWTDQFEAVREALRLVRQAVSGAHTGVDGDE